MVFFSSKKEADNFTQKEHYSRAKSEDSEHDNL